MPHKHQANNKGEHSDMLLSTHRILKLTEVADDMHFLDHRESHSVEQIQLHYGDLEIALYLCRVMHKKNRI